MRGRSRPLLHDNCCNSLVLALSQRKPFITSVSQRQHVYEAIRSQEPEQSNTIGLNGSIRKLHCLNVHVDMGTKNQLTKCLPNCQITEAFKCLGSVRLIFLKINGDWLKINTTKLIISDSKVAYNVTKYSIYSLKKSWKIPTFSTTILSRTTFFSTLTIIIRNVYWPQNQN